MVGTSLEVQWLRLQTSNAGGVGLIPSQGTNAVWHKSYITEENWSAISTKWKSERTGKEKTKLALFKEEVIPLIPKAKSTHDFPKRIQSNHTHTQKKKKFLSATHHWYVGNRETEKATKKRRQYWQAIFTEHIIINPYKHLMT